MILEWNKRSSKRWIYPYQLLKDGIPIGAIGQFTDGWCAALYRPHLREIVMRHFAFKTREEAEAWLIAVVRMSQ
jgi:hypothetical protein